MTKQKLKKVIEEINGVLYEKTIYENGVCGLKRIRRKGEKVLQAKKLFGAKTIYELKEEKKGIESNE